MSTTDSTTYNLVTTPLHLGDTSVLPIDDFKFDGPSFMAYTEKHCSQGSPNRLMFIEESPVNWGAWECHQEGDEVVVVLEGEGVFFQERDNAVIEIPFKAGDVVLNPKGIWHTADVTVPMKAMYLTPCPGTEHRVRE
jgi:uncharacterized cupin superfamily protein